MRPSLRRTLENWVQRIKTAIAWYFNVFGWICWTTL